MIDAQRIERAEAQLDAFVEARVRAAKAESDREALWQASVDRYHARRREANRAAWANYHLGQAARLKGTAAALAAGHRAAAEALLEEPSGTETKTREEK